MWGTLPQPVAPPWCIGYSHIGGVAADASILHAYRLPSSRIGYLYSGTGFVSRCDMFTLRSVTTKVGYLLRETFRQWRMREPFNKSVIMAYYTIFSLPGLLVIMINVAGYFYNRDAVTSSIVHQVDLMLGQDTASDIESIIGRASVSQGSTLASILGVVTLLFGATGVFYQLQQILNAMWDVQPQPRQKLLKLVGDRLFSFGLILAMGFLLLISLVISAALSALSTWMSTYLPDTILVAFNFLDIVVSLSVITLLFAALYKFLPDARIRWRDVWYGALLTSVLFVLAKFALGLYFGKSNPGSTYGAAGSVILIMLWVSYAGMIMLFGAEFTQVYANRYGDRMRPAGAAPQADQSNPFQQARMKQKQKSKSPLPPEDNIPRRDKEFKRRSIGSFPWVRASR